MTAWVANITLPYLHGMTTTLAGFASYALGAGANFLLTPLAATTTMTSPITELGMQMNLDPRILFYAFQYGLDNYIFPYEYAVLLYFFSSGYMLFKDMVKVLAARMVLTGVFLVLIAIPFWKFILACGAPFPPPHTTGPRRPTAAARLQTLRRAWTAGFSPCVAPST